MSATLTQRAGIDGPASVSAVSGEGWRGHAIANGNSSKVSERSGKRIVLATYGSPGDVQPFLAIGQELQQRGLSPLVATSELYRPMVARAGLDFCPIRPDRLPGQKDPDFMQRLGRAPLSPAALFRDMFMPDLRSSTEDLVEVTRGADCVVTHTLLPGGRLAAEFHGITWVSAVMQPMGYLSVHEPPVIGPEWISMFLRRAGSSATRHAFSVVKSISAAWTRDWHQLRRDLQLPETLEHPLWEGQHSSKRSLGLFPQVLGTPQPDWPMAARVTGFPAFRPADRRLSDELEEFLQEGDPPVVFTLGTTAVNDPGSFYEVGTRAASDLGLRSVLVIGNRVDQRPRRLGKNTIAIDYAPHDLLFPRARIVVHQAGIGTLSEALFAGKPMLIMPYGHDQADNAWRAERLGVARVVPRRNFNEREVRTALQRLLEDPGVFESASQVRHIVQRDAGASRAADNVEAAMGTVSVRTPDS